VGSRSERHRFNRPVATGSALGPASTNLKLSRSKIRVAAEVPNDVTLIVEHLFSSYQELGYDLQNAMARAAARINEALAYLRTFKTHPHRGTGHRRRRNSLRTITDRKFVFYLEIDETASEVRILAIFFGAADHRRLMADRLRD